MTEQWKELKETITEMRDNDGTGTQQDVCKFLANYMETLEKQMQELTDAKETIIKSALKYLVKMQIEEGSVGFAVDNDHDHDCCWDDVLAWLEAQPCKDAVSRTLVHEAITASIAESENPYEMWQRIEALPSVKPKYTDEEIDKAQAVEQAYVDKMVELAVEEAKRPKGKWIRITNGAMREKYICSECGRQIEEDGIEKLIAIKYPYCHCGAEMSGGEEE